MQYFPCRRPSAWAAQGPGSSCRRLTIALSHAQTSCLIAEQLTPSQCEGGSAEPTVKRTDSGDRRRNPVTAAGISGASGAAMTSLFRCLPAGRPYSRPRAGDDNRDARRPNGCCGLAVNSGCGRRKERRSCPRPVDTSAEAVEPCSLPHWGFAQPWLQELYSSFPQSSRWHGESNCRCRWDGPGSMSGASQSLRLPGPGQCLPHALRHSVLALDQPSLTQTSNYCRELAAQPRDG
jgi:hypothetical protein